MKMRCLGRLPHNPAEVAAVPPLARYLPTPGMMGMDWHAAASAPIPDWTRNIPPGDWGVYGNDKLNDCTAAGIAHAKDTWGSYNAPYRAMRDPEDAVSLYSASAGYVRGNKSTDRGARCIDVLSYCHHNEVNGDKLSAYVTTDPHRHDHIEIAIRVFGGVYVGAIMHAANMEQEVWDVRDGDQSVVGGHCIWVPRPLTPISWGSQMACTIEWWDNCVEEVYALLSPRWVISGHTPAGLPVSEMIQDMTELVGG